MPRITSHWIVITTFVFSLIGPYKPAHAFESVAGLPAPGAMVDLSPAYQPVLIKGLTVHKENPFLFDFIVDRGQDKLSGQPLKQEGQKLIKYFLASLAIPDSDVWVNLSPYEKDRMIPDALGQTDMGRDLLEQDYILKQITASLIYPEKQLGKTFWNKVYAKARSLYGNTEVPVNTFNKVWIMADSAQVFEHNQTAFVVSIHLKVMLEEDYLALQKHSIVLPASTRNDTHSIGANIVRSIILPELEKEVNTGKNFANLRQIVNSMVLANWYKKNLKQALLNQVYANKDQVKGIDLNNPAIKEQIYEQYLKAYKKGVFNYIKEEPTADGQSMPRKYFSGGFVEGKGFKDFAMTNDPATLAPIEETNNGWVDFATIASTQMPQDQSSKDAAMANLSDKLKEYLENLKPESSQKELNYTVIQYEDGIIDLNLFDMDDGSFALRLNRNGENIVLLVARRYFDGSELVWQNESKSFYEYFSYKIKYLETPDGWKQITHLLEKRTKKLTNAVQAYLASEKRQEAKKEADARKDKLAQKAWNGDSAMNAAMISNDTPLKFKNFLVTTKEFNSFHQSELYNLEPRSGSKVADPLSAVILFVASQAAKEVNQYLPRNPKIFLQFELNNSGDLVELHRLDYLSFMYDFRMSINRSKFQKGITISNLSKLIYEVYLNMYKTHGRLMGRPFSGEPKEGKELLDFCKAFLMDIKFYDLIDDKAMQAQVKFEKDAANAYLDYNKSQEAKKEAAARKDKQAQKAWNGDSAMITSLKVDASGNVKLGENSYPVKQVSDALNLLIKKLSSYDKKGYFFASWVFKNEPLSFNVSLMDDLVNRYEEKYKISRDFYTGVQDLYSVRFQELNNEMPWPTVRQAFLNKAANELLNQFTVDIRDINTDNAMTTTPISPNPVHRSSLQDSQNMQHLWQRAQEAGLNPGEILGKFARVHPHGGGDLYAFVSAKIAEAHIAEAEPGGIDLSTSGMQWKVSRDGRGVEMNVDPGMIERVRREGIHWLTPVIFKMTPMASIWPLAGLQAPKV